VRIELSRDGGSSWSVLAPSVVNSAATTGTFSWSVSGPTTQRARVRVTWIRDAAVQDGSDVNFRIIK
jgi:hypothetical protein